MASLLHEQQHALERKPRQDAPGVLEQPAPLPTMAMATSTSLHAFGLPSAPEDADEDIILEDAGFFSGPIEAQKALNELGLQPSPPKARRYMDEEDDMPFDLDRELEAEDEQEEEEENYSQSQHGGDGPEGVDAALESNGLLHPTDECQPSSPVQHSHTVEPSSVAVPATLSREEEDKLRHEMAQQARVASTSRAPVTTTRSVDVEKEDEELGQNGLPKYIAAGTATATLLDGSTIRFEKKRRMKGWKVSVVSQRTSSLLTFRRLHSTAKSEPLWCWRN